MKGYFQLNTFRILSAKQKLLHPLLHLILTTSLWDQEALRYYCHFWSWRDWGSRCKSCVRGHTTSKLHRQKAYVVLELRSVYFQGVFLHWGLLARIVTRVHYCLSIALDVLLSLHHAGQLHFSPSRPSVLNLQDPMIYRKGEVHVDELGWDGTYAQTKLWTMHSSPGTR